MPRRGAHVVVGARKQDRLDRVAGEIREMGRESLAVSTDVTVPEQVDNLIQKTLDAFGRLDIMVANAGGGGFSGIMKAKLADWDPTIGLNLDSEFLCDVGAAKVMIEQGHGGKIINISSTAGINLNPGLAAYAAAKAGMINLTKSLAVIFAEHNINVNCVAPGFTATPTSGELASPRQAPERTVPGCRRCCCPTNRNMSRTLAYSSPRTPPRT